MDHLKQHMLGVFETLPIEEKHSMYLLADREKKLVHNVSIPERCRRMLCQNHVYVRTLEMKGNVTESRCNKTADGSFKLKLPSSNLLSGDRELRLKTFLRARRIALEAVCSYTCTAHSPCSSSSPSWNQEKSDGTVNMAASR